MSASMKGRSLLTLDEFSADEIQRMVGLAAQVKAEKRARRFPARLRHRNIALVFLKPSCRTRASFLVAAADEGASLQALPKEEIRFGVKESVKDIARVLGRLYDGIALRADQAVVEAFATYAGIPVWNALSEDHHPTQVLADLLTIQEQFGRIQGITLAFVGDGRSNMVASLAVAARKLGFHLRVVAPRSRWPGAEVLDGPRAGAGPGSVTATEDIAAGVRGADVVYGDIWVSMGQEDETAALVAALSPYRITQDVMRATGNPMAVFLHCLPALHDAQTEFARAHPGVCDVDDDVFESWQSRVFDQSENRMHTIKALMLLTLNG
jgi:ornithine carbamoyltransferase